jgi:nitrile hydratase subunit beta
MTNGPHDVGGLRGFGPVDPGDPEELVWPEGWEPSCVAAILQGIGSGWFNVDQFRARMEELPDAAYWTMGYYRRWQYTLERNLVLGGHVAAGEIAERVRALGEGTYERPAGERDPALVAGIDALIRDGGPIFRPAPAPPRFRVGDRVRTCVTQVERPGEQHHRTPAYAQGKAGVIEVVHPSLPLPDASVRGEEVGEHVYAVSFAASELWADGDPRARVSYDAYESYLEPVKES